MSVSTYSYIGWYSSLLWNVRYCQCMINISFKHKILKFNQLKIISSSQIFQKLSNWYLSKTLGPNIWGANNTLKIFTYPTSFSGKWNTSLRFRNKCRNHPCVWDLFSRENWDTKKLHIYIYFVQVLLQNSRLSLDHKCQKLFYVWNVEDYSNRAETGKRT